MRQIRFRAYCKPKNRMIYDIQNEFEGRIEPGMNCFADYLNNDDFVVEQDTGLKDKNGKEIFENDILMKEEEVATNGYIFNNYTVEFYNGWFKGIPGDMSSLLEPEDFEDCEIIGNIHNRRR